MLFSVYSVTSSFRVRSLWYLDSDNDSYRQTCDNRTWVGNKIVDHSDVFRESPVGAAPTTSLFST